MSAQNLYIKDKRTCGGNKNIYEHTHRQKNTGVLKNKKHNRPRPLTPPVRLYQGFIKALLRLYEGAIETVNTSCKALSRLY
jgi:hypothetical protein